MSLYSQRPALKRTRAKSGGHTWKPVEGCREVYACPCGVVYAPNRSRARSDYRSGTTHRRYRASFAGYERGWRSAMLREPRCER